MTISNQDGRVQTATAAAVLSYNFSFPVFSEEDILVIIRDGTVSPATEETLVLNTDYTVTLNDGGASGGTVVLSEAPPEGSSFISIILDPALVQETSLDTSGRFKSDEVEQALDKMLNLAKRAKDLALRAMRRTDGSTSSVGEWDAESFRITNVDDPTEASDASNKSYVDGAVAAATLDPTTPVSAFMSTVLDDADAAAALATLGAGAKGVDLFEADTDQGALTQLGLPLYARFLVIQSSDSAWREGLNIPDQIPLVNVLDNSDFQVWQLGPTFNGSTPYSGANDDDVYQADQWKFLTETNDSVDTSKLAGTDLNDLPVGAKCGAKFTQQIADTKWGVWQTIESAKSEPLGGKDCTLSVWIKAPNNLKQFKLLIVEWQGTADDITTSDPISAWNGAQVRPSLGTNWALVTGGELDITVTGSDWERFKLEGVEMPASPNNLAVFLCTNDASFGATAEVFVTGFKLEESEVATPYQSKEFAVELAQARRFFVKTCDIETYLEQGIGLDTGELIQFGHNNGTSGNAYAAAIHWRFPLPMLKTPTVTTFNPVSANANWRESSLPEDLAVTVDAASKHGVALRSANANSSTAPGEFHIHAQADARF